jgi:hypothetical protein
MRDIKHESIFLMAVPVRRAWHTNLLMLNIWRVGHRMASGDSLFLSSSCYLTLDRGAVCSIAVVTEREASPCNKHRWNRCYLWFSRTTRSMFKVLIS